MSNTEERRGKNGLRRLIAASEKDLRTILFFSFYFTHLCAKSWCSCGSPDHLVARRDRLPRLICRVQFAFKTVSDGV